MLVALDRTGASEAVAAWWDGRACGTPEGSGALARREVASLAPAGSLRRGDERSTSGDDDDLVGRFEPYALGLAWIEDDALVHRR